VTDTTSPTVAFTDPASDKTDVPIGTGITAVFSERINASTVTTSTFTLKDITGTSISGTVGASGETATSTPSTELDYETTYTATLTTGMEDTAGNPMACAAAYATLLVFEEEKILDNVQKVGAFIMQSLKKMKEKHPIIGDVRGKGLLLAIDLVRDRNDNEPFVDAGKMVYEKAFKKGVAWIPAENILRLAPPLIMTKELAAKALEIIEESIFETEQHYGYTSTG